MHIHPPARYRPSEITPPKVYQQRRRFLTSLAATPAAAAALFWPTAQALSSHAHPDHTLDARGYHALTPESKVTQHNNFYELGPSKDEPYENRHLYQPEPWKIEVIGEVNNPQTFDIDDLRKLAAMEERIYRLRCVEAWSMVVPWIGYSLSHLINKVEPNSHCKFVHFETFNPEQLFPDDSNGSLPWPYIEALRLDEAMHPLTLMVFGLYGENLPTQNGAPTRFIIPWKYGFKSGKAPVRIVFSREQPTTTWNQLQPSEYGFYANVNPNVHHPRWRQNSEKAISDSLFPKRRETDLFNGFADEVASLYTGMDLSVNF